MEKKLNLIRCFDDEVEGKKDKMNIHVNMLYLEAIQVRNSMYVFEVIDKEWSRRAASEDKLSYSEVRTILFESLAYRIVLGMSKLMGDSTGYTVIKACRTIDQMSEFKTNADVKKATRDIYNFFESSEMTKVLVVYRDKFYAHLDKELILSDCRIDPSSSIQHLNSDRKEMDELIELIGKLYAACFGAKLTHNLEVPSDREIIEMFFGA